MLSRTKNLNVFWFGKALYLLFWTCRTSDPIDLYNIYSIIEEKYSPSTDRDGYTI